MTTKVDNTASEENKVCEEEFSDNSEKAGDGCAENAGEAEAKAEEAADAEEKADADEAGSDEQDAESGTDEAGKETGSEEEDEDLKTKHLRLMADFQNYKRRSEEAKTMSYSHGKEDLLTDLLPIIDNFERALESEDDGGNFKEGMEMIFKQLMDILERTGLKEIEAKGKEFDPNYHNAVMTEDSDEYESNYVSEVLQKGYTFKDKVIRPSMVKVTN